jgi:hypothetical protein
LIYISILDNVWVDGAMIFWEVRGGRGALSHGAGGG